MSDEIETREVRARFVSHHSDGARVHKEHSRQVLNAWYAAEIRKARVEALREAAQQAPLPADPYGGFDHESLRAAKIQIGNWLRGRADQIEEDQ